MSMTNEVVRLEFLFWFQDFQKDIARAAEVYASIGHKHIEIGNIFYFSYIFVLRDSFIVCYLNYVLA